MNDNCSLSCKRTLAIHMRIHIPLDMSTLAHTHTSVCTHVHTRHTQTHTHTHRHTHGAWHMKYRRSSQQREHGGGQLGETRAGWDTFCHCGSHSNARKHATNKMFGSNLYSFRHGREQWIIWNCGLSTWDQRLKRQPQSDTYGSRQGHKNLS